MSGVYSNVITGSAGAPNPAGSGVNGGDGLSLTTTGAISITSTGTITGGAGGNGGTSGTEAGGLGGVGIYLADATLITNRGAIAGGMTGYTAYAQTSLLGGNGLDLKLAGTAVNYGTITGGRGGGGNSSSPGIGGNGIDLFAGGSINNGGLIIGGRGGSQGGAVSSGAGSGGGGVGIVTGGAATVTNSATIVGGAGGYAPTEGSDGGAGGAALQFSASGMVTNTGTIDGGMGSNQNPSNDVTVGSGGAGISFAGIGTVINQGLIEGGNIGVSHNTAGLQGGGPAPVGGTALSFAQAGTVTNAGTIEAGAAGSTFIGTALTFAGGGGDLIIDPSAVFIGAVSAYSTGNNILLNPGSGSLTGIGSQFTGFNSLSFATGAHWNVSGSYTGSGFSSSLAIDGLSGGDTLVLDGITASASQASFGAQGLVFNETNGAAVTLDIVGNFTSTDFTVTNVAGNAVITAQPPCFAAGTRILTTRGEITVENLRLGDQIILHQGGVAPVTWIGQRRIALERHPKPDTVQPVLITTGAINDGLPSRDLYVSPDHALYLAGHLIPAKALVNGTTIRQVTQRSVTYYHIELPEHAVLSAEGMPAESYLETGNRGGFENGPDAMLLHPDFAQTCREQNGCAPFCEQGAVVEAVRAAILARAATQTSDDPMITLCYQTNGDVAIESRSMVPGHLTPDPRDRRRLGVKIAEIRLNGAPLSLDHPDLIKGWHNAEADGRWTDGRAIIPAALVAGAQSIEITLAATLAYPIANAMPNQHAARPGA